MNKILIADDEEEIVELLSIYFTNEHYSITKANDGVEALEALAKDPKIDLLVLDIMMPKMNGMQVVDHLRKQNNQIPIIFLTAKATDMDKIKGLVLGADDYVSKPFNPLEVVARAQSILRRSVYQQKLAENKEEDEEICVGPLIINSSSHEVVTVLGKKIQLTALEFGILRLLAKNCGKVFSAEELYEQVWQTEAVVSAKTVMVHVSHLRDKIETATEGQKVIETVWGVGYKIEKK